MLALQFDKPEPLLSALCSDFETHHTAGGGAKTTTTASHAQGVITIDSELEPNPSILESLKRGGAGCGGLSIFSARCGIISMDVENNRYGTNYSRQEEDYGSPGDPDVDRLRPCDAR